MKFSQNTFAHSVLASILASALFVGCHVSTSSDEFLTQLKPSVSLLIITTCKDSASVNFKFSIVPTLRSNLTLVLASNAPQRAQA
jgi:hypothetical protein